jgi:hypothetical protein
MQGYSDPFSLFVDGSKAFFENKKTRQTCIHRKLPQPFFVPNREQKEHEGIEITGLLEALSSQVEPPNG